MSTEGLCDPGDQVSSSCCCNRRAGCARPYRNDGKTESERHQVEAQKMSYIRPFLGLVGKLSSWLRISALVRLGTTRLEASCSTSLPHSQLEELLLSRHLRALKASLGIRSSTMENLPLYLSESSILEHPWLGSSTKNYLFGLLACVMLHFGISTPFGGPSTYNTPE